jgi:selenocysteine-specific elongation factor
MATTVLLDCPLLEPGGSALVQFFLAEEVVATWNQPLVIRCQSPARTMGGGRVLEPNAAKRGRPDQETLGQLQALRNSSPLDRAAATLYLAGWRGWQVEQLPRLAGVSADESLVASLKGRGVLHEIQVSPLRVLRVHQHSLDWAADQVVGFLDKLHAQSPLKLTFPVHSVRSAFAWLGEPAVIDAVLKQLDDTGRIRRTPSGIALEGRGPKLTRAQQLLLSELIGWFRAAGISSSSLAELQERAGANRDAVGQLLAIAAGAGELVQVAPEYWLHAEVEARARSTVQSAFGQRPFTVSQLREALATSRKYAVPLCEYWDRIGFTSRSGDMRTLSAAAIKA